MKENEGVMTKMAIMTRTKRGNPKIGKFIYGDNEIWCDYSPRRSAWNPQDMNKLAQEFIKQTNWQSWNGMYVFQAWHNDYVKVSQSDVEAVKHHIYNEFSHLNLTLKTFEELLEYIKLMRPNQEWSASDYVYFQNCKYNWKTNKFEDLGNEPMSPMFIDIHITDKNHYDEVSQFETLLDNVSIDNDTKKMIKEVFALSMVDANYAKKMFIAYGDTHTGKSFTFGKLLSSLIGKENISNETLTDLTTKFGAVSLADKLVNFVDDENGKVSAYKLDKLRSITSGETISINRKYLSPIQVVLPAKLIFNMNNLPEVRDESGAYDKRLHIIPFLKEFHKQTKEDKDKNTALLNEIQTDNKLRSNIIVHLLREIWVNYRMGWDLTKSRVSRELQETESLNSQSIKGWLKEEFDNVIKPYIWEGAFFSSAELYSAYSLWNKRNGFKGISSNVFGKHIRKVLNNLLSTDYVVSTVSESREIDEYEWKIVEDKMKRVFVREARVRVIKITPYQIYVRSLRTHE